MELRTLGKSGLKVSAMGLGCWAIGGVHWRDKHPIGWGETDDAESIRAIQRGVDLGVNFIDTADVYGCGHSETVIAKALAGRRDQVVIATKFGYKYDEETKESPGVSGEPDYVRQCCDQSLRRLQTDHLDLYQYHLGGHENGAEVLAVLEELHKKGKIKSYGWSTDDPKRAALFAEAPHCGAIQQHLNLFEGNWDTLAVCEKNRVASVNRGPLGMGLLTGKFTAGTEFPADDIRHGWNLKEGGKADQVKKLQALRDILTSNGRTLAQGALAWIWAKSPVTVPIPGFKTVQQVEENAGALKFGPLNLSQMAEIEKLVRG
jgi:aryl-alcohol dehydrogenase-like predicted oxidoreductase